TGARAFARGRGGRRNPRHRRCDRGVRAAGGGGDLHVAGCRWERLGGRRARPPSRARTRDRPPARGLGGRDRRTGRGGGDDADGRRAGARARGRAATVAMEACEGRMGRGAARSFALPQRTPHPRGRAGVRRWVAERATLARRQVTVQITPEVAVRVKVLEQPDAAGVRVKPEYDDVLAAARALGRPPLEVARVAERDAEALVAKSKE